MERENLTGIELNQYKTLKWNVMNIQRSTKDSKRENSKEFRVVLTEDTNIEILSIN